MFGFFKRGIEYGKAVSSLSTNIGEIYQFFDKLKDSNLNYNFKGEILQYSVRYIELLENPKYQQLDPLFKVFIPEISGFGKISIAFALVTLDDLVMNLINKYDLSAEYQKLLEKSSY